MTISNDLRYVEFDKLQILSKQAERLEAGIQEVALVFQNPMNITNEKYEILCNSINEFLTSIDNFRDKSIELTDECKQVVKECIE